MIDKKITKSDAKKNLKNLIKLIGNKTKKLIITQQDIEREVSVMRDDKKKAKNR